MSKVLGAPGERWPLARAIDALADSARRAGVPGWIWIAGVFYPSLVLNFELVRGLLGIVQSTTGLEIPYAGEPGGLFAVFGQRALTVGGSSIGARLLGTLVLLPVFALLYRMIVGLAKESDPGAWTAASDAPRSSGVPARRPGGPSFRTVWEAGRGLGLSACGMWLLLLGMLLAAVVLLMAPLILALRLVGLESVGPLVLGALLPGLVLVALYAIVLQVLNQLALHSLAHNHRGVGSALNHAWRLVRASPWSAMRATAVDFLLSFLLVATEFVLGRSLLPGGLAALALVALSGFVGVTRAGYWARAYRALGGLSVSDRLPGLG